MKPAVTRTPRLCSSFNCPRIAETIPSSQLSRDNAGRFWCNSCDKQRDLMNWAHEHHWPTVRVQGQMLYAIQGDAQDWLMSLVAASQDMIAALHETLVQGLRLQIGLDDRRERIERVRALLEACEEEDI